MVQNSYFYILPQLVVYSSLIHIRPAPGSKELCAPCLRGQRESAVDRLLEESRELAENRAYKEALLFAELAHYMDPGNPAVQQQRSLAQGEVSCSWKPTG